MTGAVLLIRANAFHTPRLSRTAKSLRESGLNVQVLAWNRGAGEEQETSFQAHLRERGFSIDEIWVGEVPLAQGMRGAIKRLQYMWKVAWYLRNHGPFDVIHTINLDSALPVVLARILGWHRGRQVFDIADYFRFFYTIPDWLATFMGKIEQWAIGRADALIVPDENRKSDIPRKYWSKTTIVTNAPDIGETEIARIKGQDLGPNGAMNVFYYGGLSGDRCVKLLLQVAGQVENANFWFAGWGELVEEVRLAAQVQANVHFLGRLSHEEVLRRVAKMDLICIVYDPDFSVNRMASPNKLFEAMAIGKPVVVARGTSIDLTVTAHDMGWVVDYDREALVELFHGINEQEIQRRGANAAVAYEEYKWETSKRRMHEVYESMLSSKQN